MITTPQADSRLLVNVFSHQNTVANRFIAELRDATVQKDRMRFRRNLERIGEIAAYEISRKLPFREKEVVTPLGIANLMLPTVEPVLGTILRAGLPLHQGLLNYFDHADNAFVSAYRRHHKDGTFDVHLEYISSPDLTGKILILSDPMLATGQSMVLTYRALIQKGKPAHTHIVAALASVQGIDYIKRHFPYDVSIWVGAVDEELTAQAYIVPGLGDAGDLAFGGKQ